MEMEESEEEAGLFDGKKKCSEDVLWKSHNRYESNRASYIKDGFSRSQLSHINMYLGG